MFKISVNASLIFTFLAANTNSSLKLETAEFLNKNKTLKKKQFFPRFFSS